MIGKVDPDSLASLVLDRTGAPDDRVIQGPAYGEDTAAIRLEGGTEAGILVVNADPISLAVGRVGTLGVDVAANDVAASGATPEWLTSVVLLPGSDDALDTITAQLDEAARRLGVAIVGGHSEYAPALSTPMLVLTCFGLTDRYVPTGGAEPGDRILLTKGAGIEATAILATDFRDRLDGRVPEALLESAEGFYDEVSVVPEAAVLREYANAMHDPTEGGLVDGLLELAAASGIRIEVDPVAIPIREETRRLCEAVGVDPLRTFGSGALLAAVPEESTDGALSALDEVGVEAAVVGTVEEGDGPALTLGGETFDEPVRDDMYALWE
jgi:hydrogenase expression/formation protein HypE